MAVAHPQYNSLPPPTDPSLQDVSIEDQSIEESEDRIPVFPDEIDANGDYIIDDLRLTPEQFRANYGTEEEMRQATPYTQYRWTGGVVPYKLEDNVSSGNKAKINDAIAVMNKAFVNCLTFREKTSSDKNYISVNGASGGCWSYVGMLNRGSQQLNLGNGCYSER